MFEKNDKALFTTRVIFIVFTVISVLSWLAIGITLAVEIRWYYIFLTFAGWFSCWIVWVFEKLFISYMCDIKLIRNSLYEESNRDLEIGLKMKFGNSVSPAQQKKNEAANAELERLKQRLKAGEITRGEYEALRIQLL